ncbi:surface-adhesin E family protein [Pseudomonas sp. GV071]|uniref:surface-adhesin E family protein n=1 Tax=Pseudomonas sp. GV071 TaxID=2135754 RepID=UPI000D349CD2|nr:surface-adhesin E family protein [Pseudomonas sp. GV071]PTQ68513.1 hypothetical protein C8K61_111141 [Pseudomonas sp. GV071]
MKLYEWLRGHSLVIAITALGLTGANIAHAADWERLFESDGSVYSYDKASVKRVGGFVTAWTRTDLPEAQITGGKKFLSQVDLNKFDCQERMSATLSMTAYSLKDGKGEVVASFSERESSVEYEYVIPGTVGEALLNGFCKGNL